MTATPDTLAPDETPAYDPGEDLRLLLDATLEQAAAKRKVDLLRDRIARLAVATLERTGAAPTWKVRGRGVIRLDAADPTTPVPYVADPAAFASWVAEHHPTEATATITLLPEDLASALDALALVGVEVADTHVEVRQAWQKQLLDRLIVETTDDDDAKAFTVDPDAGEVVDGIGVRYDTSTKLVVTCDSQVKAETVAQADREFFTAHPDPDEINEEA